MSHAWISGCAGCAVVVTPEDAYLLEAGTSEPPRPCPPGQLNNLRILAPDLVRSTADSYPFSGTRQELEVAWRSQSALTMLLTALDVEHSSSLRSEAAEVAERLVADPEVRERVRWRLLGTPLPREADREGIQSQKTLRELIGEALTMRPWIAQAVKIWDRLAFESPIQPDLLRDLRRLCTLYGGFAQRVLSRGDRQMKLHAWLKRVPTEEHDLLEPAAVEFLEKWWSAAVHAPATKVPRRRDPGEEKKRMEVSNKTGQGVFFTVRGVGVEAPGASRPGQKAPRRIGTLRPETSKKVSPPLGLWWKVEFHDKAGKLLASADVRDLECLVILVQEKDGSYRVSLPERRLHLRRFSA